MRSTEGFVRTAYLYLGESLNRWMLNFQTKIKEAYSEHPDEDQDYWLALAYILVTEHAGRQLINLSKITNKHKQGINKREIVKFIRDSKDVLEKYGKFMGEVEDYCRFSIYQARLLLETLIQVAAGKKTEQIDIDENYLQALKTDGDRELNVEEGIRLAEKLDDIKDVIAQKYFMHEIKTRWHAELSNLGARVRLTVLQFQRKVTGKNKPKQDAENKLNSDELDSAFTDYMNKLDKERREYKPLSNQL